MTVLQLGPYPPPHGGVQTNLVAIRQHLRHHGIHAPVINLTRHRRNPHDEVYYPRTALEVVKLLFAVPADVIHIHLGGRLTRRLVALCWLCSLLPGRRVVLTFHSGGYPSSEDGRRTTPRSLNALVLRRLDAIIAVNGEIEAFLRRLGVVASRIHVICPYAPVTVADDAELPEPLRSFCSSHRPLLTTVGLLEPEYELPLQIQALGAIRRKHPTAGLVIIGSGSLETELGRLIEEQPHRRDVLLCGDVPHPITIRTLAVSTVFLRTTRYDGDAVSVREALQLGVPVVATDNGMRPDGVRLIPRSDPAALREAIEAVLGGPSGASKSQTSSGRQVDEVLDVYSRLLGHDAGLGRPPIHSSI